MVAGRLGKGGDNTCPEASRGHTRHAPRTAGHIDVASLKPILPVMGQAYRYQECLDLLLLVRVSLACFESSS